MAAVIDAYEEVSGTSMREGKKKAALLGHSLPCPGSAYLGRHGFVLFAVASTRPPG